MLDVNDYPLGAIFPVSIALVLAAAEVGRRLGGRAARRGAVGVSTLEGAILGLLALMIGFTFSMAVQRYEARRDAVVIKRQRSAPRRCAPACCRCRTRTKS
ncbi:hypothetical protein [Reyranella sp.]|jgi:hypothetical protein|uniref:hypothetical protein n=1 Tax=Reyranella sp. TaxID=1929291 RepID=UPI003D0E0F63